MLPETKSEFIALVGVPSGDDRFAPCWPWQGDAKDIQPARRRMYSYATRSAPQDWIFLRRSECAYACINPKHFYPLPGGCDEEQIVRAYFEGGLAIRAICDTYSIGPNRIYRLADLAGVRELGAGARKGRGRSLSPEDETAIVELVQQDVRVSTVAERFGISRQTVYAVMRRCGIEPKKSRVEDRLRLSSPDAQIRSDRDLALLGYHWPYLRRFTDKVVETLESKGLDAGVVCTHQNHDFMRFRIGNKYTPPLKVRDLRSIVADPESFAATLLEQVN